MRFFQAILGSMTLGSELNQVQGGRVTRVAGKLAAVRRKQAIDYDGSSFFIPEVCLTAFKGYADCPVACAVAVYCLAKLKR